MRNNISAQLNMVINGLLLLVAVATPLFFTPLFTEFYDTSKIIFLVFVTLTLMILWGLEWVLKGKTEVVHSPFDLPLLLLALVIGLSAFFSPTQYISIFGNMPRIHGSAASYIVYILLFFITVSHLKSVGQVRNLIYGMLASGVLLAVVTLLAYFNIYMPFSFAQAAGFTPTGAAFSTAGFLVLLLPIVLYSIIQSQNKSHGLSLLPSGFSIAIATLFTVTVLLIGGNAITDWQIIFSPAYLSLYVVYGLVFAATQADHLRRSLPLLLIPVVISLVVVGLSLLPFAQKVNFLNARIKEYPREVQLPFSVSWKVAVSAFRDAPFLGTGPATFLFDFTKYRPIEHNDSKYWNVRFDTAYNEFLQTLGTNGILGVLALMFLAAVVVSFAYKGLYDDSNTENIDRSLSYGLSASAITGVVLMAFHASTVVTLVGTLMILALLVAIRRGSDHQIREYTLGDATRVQTSNVSSANILAILIFAAIFVGSLAVMYKTGTLAVADYSHRMALNAANKNGLDTYNFLVKAETLNDRADLYRTDLAQTNFALANAIATSKSPTAASPSGSLSDQDKQNIQQLLSQAIREGQAATVLSPRNPANYEVLAAIYRQISGVADNALQFALNAYGQAIQLDPYNPVLRINIGGIYYSIQNYDLAIRFFTDAVNLKPDLANAYYNLSVALRDKGDLKNAQAVAQQVVTILQKDQTNPDYKLASAYLADLNLRIATSSAAVAPAPTATPTTALEQKNLPKVLDLPKPEAGVATPSAAPKRSPNP